MTTTFVFTDTHGNPVTIGRAARHLFIEPRKLGNMLMDWERSGYEDGWMAQDKPGFYRFEGPDEWSVATIKKLNNQKRVIRTQLVSLEVST